MNTAAIYKLNRQTTRLECRAYDLKTNKVMLRPPVTPEANLIKTTDKRGRFYPKCKCGGVRGLFGVSGPKFTAGCMVCLKCGAESKIESQD